MNRRRFLLASAGAGLIFTPGAHAASSTPAATPTATPLVPLSGASDEVYRSFGLVGSGIATIVTGQPSWLAFDVLAFASAALAKRNTSGLRDNLLANYANYLNTLNEAWAVGVPKPVTIRRLGDGSSAWVAMATTDDPDVTMDRYAYSLVVVRSAGYLNTVTSISASGNPFPLMADQAAAMLTRRVGAGDVTVDDDGLHHGGLWDILPTLGDLPDGYVFDKDWPA